MPLMRRGDKNVLDGALVDGVPVEQVSHRGPTLVLLSKHDDEVPLPPGVFAVRPSAPVPVALWDYASPELIQATFDLGMRDGERYARRASDERATPPSPFG